MKVRMMMIEADDVSAADVAEVVAQTFARAAGAAPALPPPPPAPAALPPSVPTAMVKPEAGWRPRAKRPANPARETSQPRPTTPAKKMCDNCGADKPEGLHGRANCPKCGTRAWVDVPAHRDVAAGVEG